MVLGNSGVIPNWEAGGGVRVGAASVYLNSGDNEVGGCQPGRWRRENKAGIRENGEGLGAEIQ